MPTSPSDALDPPPPPGGGTHPVSTNEMVAVVHAELDRLASRMLAGDPAHWMMQTGSMVNEAYVRLLNGGGAHWTSRAEFFAAAAEAMRRVLVERIRAVDTVKRGGGRAHVSLNDHDAPDARLGVVEVVALHHALERLERQDKRLATVASLRFFAGLSVGEVAVTLAESERTVHRDWMRARAWLARELGGGDRDDASDDRRVGDGGRGGGGAGGHDGVSGAAANDRNSPGQEGPPP